MGTKQIADGIYLVSDSMKLSDGAWQDTGESYLISEESKLSSITDAKPGAFAHTAGFKKMWELDTDGLTWVEI